MRYTVETVATVEYLPEVPAADPNDGFTYGGFINADPQDVAEFLPEIPWHCHYTPRAEFTTNRKALANRLKSICGFVPRRSFKAILQNVRVAVNGTVELSATDLEIGIVTTGEDERTGDRVALVPARPFYDAIRKASGENVSCELTDGRLTVRGASGELSIPTTDDPAEYPVIGAPAPVLTIRVDAAALALAISQTIFATDTESMRYALGGVMFDVGNDTLTLAATDTRRLAVSSMTSTDFAILAGEPSKDSTRVVPVNFLAALPAFLKGAGHVELQFSENGVCVIGDNWQATSRLVEGRFPRYQDVVPTTFNREIVFHKAELLAALESASHATTETSRGIDIKTGNVNGETIVTFRGKSCERGTSVATASATLAVYHSWKRHDDKGKKTAREDCFTFDPRYLADYLRALPKSTDYVQLATNDCNSAIVLTAQGMNGSYVAMPLSRDR